MAPSTTMKFAEMTLHAPRSYSSKAALNGTLNVVLLSELDLTMVIASVRSLSKHISLDVKKSFEAKGHGGRRGQSEPNPRDGETGKEAKEKERKEREEELVRFTGSQFD